MNVAIGTDPAQFLFCFRILSLQCGYRYELRMSGWISMESWLRAKYSHDFVSSWEMITQSSNGWLDIGFQELRDDWLLAKRYEYKMLSCYADEVLSAPDSHM